MKMTVILLISIFFFNITDAQELMLVNQGKSKVRIIVAARSHNL